MKRHMETLARVAGEPHKVFAHLDDQTRLAEHMSKPSLMMGGGKMTYEFDEQKGQSVGSHIRMGGSAFGLQLSLDEVVTERIPPRRKVWQTVGTPRLVVIGSYEMGFELSATDQGSALRVWIDYELPPRGLGRFVPALGDAYARWCVNRMASDAILAFGNIAAPAGDPIRQSDYARMTGQNGITNLQRLAACALALGGVILMGMGLYFAILRPPLLPEDMRYMGATIAQIQTVLPGLEPWLARVFGVLGGFMFATGLLTVYVAATAFRTGKHGVLAVIAVSGIASIGWMAITNFVIDSDFKWILLAFALLWVLALVLSWVGARRIPQ